MHPTAAFRDDPLHVQRALVAEVGFAQVFAQTNTGPHVAHTPVVAAGDDTLRFHLARSNALADADGLHAVVTLTGPDAYISPRWYAGSGQVPTWNYTAIELEGTLRRLPASALEPLMAQFVAKHEAAVRDVDNPWTMAELPDVHKQALLRGIVGFELRIGERRETVKLSQNKPTADRSALIAALERQGENAMADAIRRTLT